MVARRESDLAMIALFGLPRLTDAVDSYQRARPLRAGWQQRIALLRLRPLAVHRVLCGGGCASLRRDCIAGHLEAPDERSDGPHHEVRAAVRRGASICCAIAHRARLYCSRAA